MSNELVPISPDHAELATIQQVKHTRSLTYLVTGKTPLEVVKQRRIRGGREANYVPGWWFQEQLNALFGGSWDFVILERHVELECSQIWVSGELIIHLADGREVRRPGTGGAEIDRYGSDVHKTDRQGRDLPEILHKKGEVIDLADDIKSAETEALSRAARWLGLAADVYNLREETK